MNWIGRLFGKREGRGTSSLDLFRQIYGGQPSRTGVSVTWKSALEVATVLACVRVIANGVAQVPWRVYRDDGASRRPAADHPLHRLLYRRPNAWQTSFELRETIMFHVLLTGNAFVWKGLVGRERALRSLEPIEPGRVIVRRAADGSLTYEVRADDGTSATFGAADIWHLRGPSWNSWMGLEAVKLAREAIGLSVATEAAHADFHKGSARISGLLSLSNTVGTEKFVSLAAWLDQHSEGGPRAGKPLVLDNGASFTPFGMSGVDAEHLDTRRYQVEEICRCFGVMPIMIGHADKTATYASAEQMFLAHVVHTLSPWYERLDESADVNLLGEAAMGQGLYVKFSPNGLMRGAAKDRAEFYAKALGSGGSPAWMVANEVRALEEMDSIEGGDALFVPPKSGGGDAVEPGEGDAA